jgi:transposase
MTNMTRLRGRAPYGERLKMAAPFGHWHTQTFVAGLRCDGLVAPWVLDGPMNGEAFETYIETQLAPILVRGDVVIMDNLSSHKTERVEQLIRERGAWPLFLPPYSPDLNPIEMAFAKLKELLRKLNARTIDQLWRVTCSPSFTRRLIESVPLLLSRLMVQRDGARSPRSSAASRPVALRVCA